MTGTASATSDRHFPVITWTMIGLTAALSIYLMAKMMLTETPLNRRFEVEMVYLYQNFEIKTPPAFEVLYESYSEDERNFVDMMFDDTLRTPEAQIILDTYEHSGYLRVANSSVGKIESASEAQRYFDDAASRSLNKNSTLLLHQLAFFSPKPKWLTLLSASFIAPSIVLLIFSALSLWLFGRELECRMGGLFTVGMAVLGSAFPFLIKHWVSPTTEMMSGPYGLVATLFGATMVFNLHRPFLWRRWLFWVGLGLYGAGRVLAGMLNPGAFIAMDLIGLGVGAITALLVVLSAWDVRFNPALALDRPILSVPRAAADGESAAKPDRPRAAPNENLVEETSQRITDEIERGQAQTAFQVFQAYDEITDKLLPPAVSLALVEAMLEAKDNQAALVVAGAITRGSRCGVRTQLELLRLAVRFGQKWGLEVAAKLEGEVLPSRKDFHEMVASLRFTLANQARNAAVPAVPADPFNSSMSFDAPFDEQGMTNLLPPPDVRDVQLQGIEGQQLVLSFQGKQRLLPMRQIQAVAVGAIKDPNSKPFLAIDLVLQPSGETRKLLRLRSTELSPKKFFPDIESPVHGFKQLVGLLLMESRATPLPSQQSVMGAPYATYLSLQAFTQTIHQRAEDLAYTY